jgi:hypothetical protein
MRLLPLAAALLLAGCAPRYHVSRAADPFAGVTTRRMHGNVLGGGDAGGDWVALNVEETRPAADTPRYALLVDYRTRGEWLQVRPGESLLLLVDGERVALTGAGSARARKETRAARMEAARYPASAALVTRMARAQEVRVRLVGRRYHVDRTLTRANRARIARFLGLPAAPAPAAPASPPRQRTLPPGAG